MWNYCKQASSKKGSINNRVFFLAKRRMFYTGLFNTQYILSILYYILVVAERKKDHLLWLANKYLEATNKWRMAKVKPKIEKRNLKEVLLSWLPRLACQRGPPAHDEVDEGSVVAGCCSRRSEANAVAWCSSNGGLSRKGSIAVEPVWWKVIQQYCCVPKEDLFQKQ